MQGKKIVVSIKAASNHYYRTELGHWAGDPRKAKDFPTVEDARQEAERIGVVSFMQKTCIPHVGISSDWGNSGKRNKEKESLDIIEDFVVVDFFMTGNQQGEIASVNVLYKQMVQIESVKITCDSSREYAVELPDNVLFQQPAFDDMVRVIRDTLDAVFVR